ncbi:MAG: DUF4595 domain-containing protein [Bacteroidales bacterium]|nr:DUF4595 domain-containing protein [Bacteroidales bacterium]
MKKVLYFISAIALMATAIACGDNKGPDKIDDETGVAYRISQLRDAWDWWDFVYNENGQIIKVDRDNGDRVWNFAWNGKTATITGRDEFNFVLGDNGMIATLNWKDGSVYTFTYDKDGYLTQSKKDGAVVSTITVTNGNITKVVEGETTMEFEYGTVENKYGIQHFYQDEFNVLYPKWYRFIIESGLLGKASKNVATKFKMDGTEICPIECSVETPTEASDGYVAGKEYTIVKGKKAPTDEMGKVIHKYLFEEYTPAK